MDWKEFDSSKKMAIKCLNTKRLDTKLFTNLWQCVTESETCSGPIFVTCTGKAYAHTLILTKFTPVLQHNSELVKWFVNRS